MEWWKSEFDSDLSISLQSKHLLVLQWDFNYAVKKPTYINDQESAGKQNAFSRLLKNVTYNGQVEPNNGNSL